METHFIRRHQRFHSRLGTPLESVVYQQTPQDRLVVREDIVRAVLAYYAAHREPGESPPAPREVEGVMASLAERGFLLEVNGVRLERWLDDVSSSLPPAGSRSPNHPRRP